MIKDCLWVRKKGALYPADPVTEGIMFSIEQDKPFTTSEPRQRRNPKHHKYMMKLLSKAVENTDKFTGIDDLMTWLKLRSGMVQEIVMHEGRTVLIPRSISFASMSQPEFKRVADRWLWIICNEVIPGTDPDALIGESIARAA